MLARSFLLHGVNFSKTGSLTLIETFGDKLFLSVVFFFFFFSFSFGEEERE